jgi:hypothetical protein
MWMWLQGWSLVCLHYDSFISFYRLEPVIFELERLKGPVVVVCSRFFFLHSSFIPLLSDWSSCCASMLVCVFPRPTRLWNPSLGRPIALCDQVGSQSLWMRCRANGHSGPRLIQSEQEARFIGYLIVHRRGISSETWIWSKVTVVIAFYWSHYNRKIELEICTNHSVPISERWWKKSGNLK